MNTEPLRDSLQDAWHKFLTDMPTELCEVVISDTKVLTVMQRVFEAGYWQGTIRLMDYIMEIKKLRG